MRTMKYKGYTGSVEYSDEDGCLFGQVQGLHAKLISYEEEIRKDFDEAVDEYLASCSERGVEPAKPYSCELNLRMPSELHAAIASAAKASGTTINEFINRLMRSVVHFDIAQ